MNRRDFLKTSAALGVAAAFPFPTAASEPKPKEIFTTGLPTLDKLMGGGLRRGELAIVLAPIAGGKSAFCRTVRKANFPHHKGDLAISKGNNDLLFLSPTHSLIMTNMEVNLETHESEWDKLSNTSRYAKSLAMQTGDAVIWSLPAITYVRARDREIADYGSSYGFLRSADYCFLLTRKRKQVIVYKNRHGEKGAVDIEFYSDNGMALLREKTA